MLRLGIPQSRSRLRRARAAAFALTGGSTSADGTQVTFTFSRPASGFTTGTNGFALVGNGILNYVLDYASGDGTTSVTFDVNFGTISNGVTLVGAYTPGSITDGAANPLPALSNLPVTNNVPGGSLQLLTLNKLVYRGAFKVNYNGITGEHRYGRGLTMHEGRGNLLSTTRQTPGGTEEYGIYEYPPAVPIIGTGYLISQYNAATAVKYYGVDPYTPSGGVNLMGNNDLQGDNGLIWVTGEQVIWLYSEGYGSNLGMVGYAILDYANETAEGFGRFRLTNPTGFKAYSTGGFVLPQDFADTYLDGNPVVLGVGRNQSIISQQDDSQGYSFINIDDITTFTGDPLTLFDCSTSGAGATTVHSATGGFTGQVPGRPIIFFSGGGTGFSADGTTGCTVVSVTDDNNIVVTPSPTPLAAGSLGKCWSAGNPVTSLPMAGFFPSTLSQGVGEYRMVRPDGTSLVFQYLDSWPNTVHTWTDSIDGAVSIDFEQGGIRYHGILFVGLITVFGVDYVSADVTPAAQSYAWGIVDRHRLFPAAGSDHKNIQPDEWSFTTFNTIDPSLYQIGDEFAIAAIVSDAAKFQSDPSGCLVTCAGHPFTANGQLACFGGSSSSAMNRMWSVTLVDADHFRVSNGNGSLIHWPGGTLTDPSAILRRAATRLPLIMGIGRSPDQKRIYIQHQVVDTSLSAPDQLQVLTEVYDWVVP